MSLRELGLTEDQEQLYRALLVDPASTPAALALDLDVSRNQVRVILAELGALALVVDDGDAPSGVRARRPNIALNELAQVNARRLTDRLRALAGCQDDILAMDELARSRTGDAAEAQTSTARILEIVQGPAAVQRRLDELAYLTTSTVDSVMPAEPRPKEVYERALPKNLLSLRRGVICRTVVSRSYLTQELAASFLLTGMLAGAQVRVTDDDVARVLVLDRSTVVVPMIPDDRDAGAIIVRHPALVYGYQRLFERLWHSSRPLQPSQDAFDAVTTDVIDADGRALLTALATGVSDESAARMMAVSPRQFRRRLSAVVATLQANGRFQAGVLAERYGLVDEA